MMDFQGKELFDVSIDTLWNHLTDMQFMSTLIPDTERIEQVDANRLVCQVRPGLSFLKGRLRLSFEIKDAERPVQLHVESMAKGIGASITVGAGIRLTSLDPNRTSIDWTGEILQRRGLLRPISPALIQAAAQKVISDFWSSFESAIRDQAKTGPMNGDEPEVNSSRPGNSCNPDGEMP